MPRFFVGKEAGAVRVSGLFEMFQKLLQFGGRNDFHTAVFHFRRIPDFVVRYRIPFVLRRVGTAGIAYSPVAIALVEIETILAAHGREDFRAFDFYVARRQ